MCRRCASARKISALLVEHLASKASRSVEFSDEALRTLERYRWPGNVRELQNVVEQALWMASGSTVEVTHLPPSVQASADQVLPVKERRKQVADELYQALVAGGYSFWEHIHPLFLERDITRHDMRELVRRGLGTTRGNYRSLLRLFGMPASDYKRFLNFLAAHDCNVDFRAYRNGTAPTGPTRAPRLLPPLGDRAAGPGGDGSRDGEGSNKPFWTFEKEDEGAHVGCALGDSMGVRSTPGGNANMVTLADLRARNVQPAWQEAVAVVQELVQTVTSTGVSLPDLEHVALIPNGDVVALPGSLAPDEPVRQAALMLQMLVEGGPTPPELAQFIERNLSGTPDSRRRSSTSRGTCRSTSAPGAVPTSSGSLDAPRPSRRTRGRKRSCGGSRNARRRTTIGGSRKPSSATRSR